jgi:antitoxin VapB
MNIEAVKIQNAKGFQAINIPENLKINDDRVYIKKMGNALYIIPFHTPWQALTDSLGEFTPDFMETRNQPPQQTRESFD